jgi:hypothetical protein
MDLSDEFRSRDIENLIAAFVALEIFQRWICRLNHGAHCAVRYNNAGSKGDA